jgi:predicted RNA-binding Zn-ribbon protein involved in translation (DUF1610 family)
MIRVKLTCGHWFETGALSRVEKRTRTTSCPKCGEIVKIVEARRLKHPPGSRRKWVEGERV